MALQEAILDVVQMMEDEAEQLRDNEGASVRLRLYAKMLRNVIKAVESVQQVVPSPSGTFLIAKEDPHAQLKARLVEEAKLGVRQSKDNLLDMAGSRMVEVVGGPGVTEGSAPEYATIPNAMPEGANTEINQVVYTLRGGRLCYSPALTQKQFGGGQ
jgi:hypothetical protein